MTSVRVTDDLRIARINFVPLGGEGDDAKILAGLEAARGYLRRELGRRVRLKYVPELRFHLDEGLSESFRVTEILDQMGSQEVSLASDLEDE
jgi:ribosome-binding factor A